MEISTSGINALTMFQFTPIFSTDIGYHEIQYYQQDFYQKKQ